MKRTFILIKKYIRAFALIEVLVVISLIGILSTIAIVIDPGTYFQRGRDAKRKSDLEIMKTAIEEYYDAYSYYPPQLPSCATAFVIGETTVVPKIPCDPKYETDYQYVTDETGQSAWYKLYTKLEYMKDPHIDDIGCRTGCGPECMYNYGITSSNISVMGCTKLMPLVISSPTPTTTPTPTIYMAMSPTPELTPTPIIGNTMYVCAPGHGQPGYCEAYDDPERSECPKAYPGDPTCKDECSNTKLRCKNASGKSVPQ